jgi:hypothetical protein
VSHSQHCTGRRGADLAPWRRLLLEQRTAGLTLEQRIADVLVRCVRSPRHGVAPDSDGRLRVHSVPTMLYTSCRSRWRSREVWSLSCARDELNQRKWQRWRREGATARTLLTMYCRMESSGTSWCFWWKFPAKSQRWENQSISFDPSSCARGALTTELRACGVAACLEFGRVLGELGHHHVRQHVKVEVGEVLQGVNDPSAQRPAESLRAHNESVFASALVPVCGGGAEDLDVHQQLPDDDDGVGAAELDHLQLPIAQNLALRGDALPGDTTSTP